MDPLEMVSDRCIRRALGFAGLAIGMVMVSLSFDMALALRSGADLSAMVAVVLLIAAWRTPRRDMRDSEAWTTLNDLLPHVARRQPKTEMQRQLRAVLRRRLLWHAERVGALAVGLWTLTLLVLAAKAF